MLPSVRVFIERAIARRTSLLGLVDSLPADYWQRATHSGAWTAKQHLAHVATTDRLVVRVIESISLESPFANLAEDRLAAIAEAEDQPVAELLDRMAEERTALVAVFARITPVDLEASLPVPGTRTPWGEPVAILVSSYLDSWARHDGDHEEGIREAIATPPDLSAVALAKRRAR